MPPRLRPNRQLRQHCTTVHEKEAKENEELLKRLMEVHASISGKPVKAATQSRTKKDTNESSTTPGSSSKKTVAPSSSDSKGSATSVTASGSATSSPKGKGKAQGKGKGKGKGRALVSSTASSSLPSTASAPTPSSSSSLPPPARSRSTLPVRAASASSTSSSGSSLSTSQSMRSLAGPKRRRRPSQQRIDGPSSSSTRPTTWRDEGDSRCSPNNGGDNGDDSELSDDLSDWDARLPLTPALQCYHGAGAGAPSGVSPLATAFPSLQPPAYPAWPSLYKPETAYSETVTPLHPTYPQVDAPTGLPIPGHSHSVTAGVPPSLDQEAPTLASPTDVAVTSEEERALQGGRAGYHRRSLPPSLAQILDNNEESLYEPAVPYTDGRPNPSSGSLDPPLPSVIPSSPPSVRLEEVMERVRPKSPKKKQKLDPSTSTAGEGDQGGSPPRRSNRDLPRLDLNPINSNARYYYDPGANYPIHQLYRRSTHQYPEAHDFGTPFSTARKTEEPFVYYQAASFHASARYITTRRPVSAVRDSPASSSPSSSEGASSSTSAQPVITTRAYGTAVAYYDYLDS